MKRPCTLLISLLALFLTTVSYGQEEAPLKTFEFTISVNKLKTEEQANKIQSEVQNIPGVKNVELILINYVLTFTCTNHAMNEYQVIDRIKEVIVSNGSEIVTINRREK